MQQSACNNELFAIRVDGRRQIVTAAVLLGLLLYGLTCAPGVLWQDSGMFQFRTWHGDLSGELGLPLAHPLYILLARAFSVLPLGDFAFRVNLFSAICGAACLGFAVDLLLSLTRSRLAAITGTLLLAVSHTFWTHAVIAEVYDLYALGLLAELWLLERYFARRQTWWLVVALLVNGLNVSNHLLALLHAPAYVGIVIWALRANRLTVKQLPLLAVAFLGGTLPYTVLIIAKIADGQPVAETLTEALVGPPNRASKVLLYDFPLVRQTIKTAQYFAMNFPTPLALLAPIGLWTAWKQPRTRWFAAATAAIFAIGFVFAFRYEVPDQFVFFTPCYVLFALLVGVAIPHVKSPAGPRQSGKSGPQTRRSVAIDRVSGLLTRPAWCLALAALPIVVYEVAPSLMRRWDISIGVKRDIPFRDSYTYFIRPRKNGEDGADQFARNVLRQAEPDGLLIADGTIMNAIGYVRDIDGIGRDVTLTAAMDIATSQPTIPLSPQAIKPFAERGAAYVCTDAAGYLPGWLLNEYDLVPEGVVFKLREK